MNVKRSLLGVMAVLLGFCPNSESAGVPLKLDRGAVSPGEWLPLGVGVPLKEGMVKDPRCVGIVSRSRGALTTQCEARTRYPDGSVQWLWADFYGPAEDSFNLVVNAAPSPATTGVQVVKQPKMVSVANGALQVTWDTQFATPVKVEGLAAKGARWTLAEGDGAGVYLVDDKGQRAMLGGPEAELDFRVETANSLRAVIRVEGWYVRGKTDKVARAVVRYHIYWGQPWMRVEHHFIIARDNDEVAYREVGIRLPLKPGKAARALFGVKHARAAEVALGGQTREAFVFQSKYPVYYRTESECVVGSNVKSNPAGKEAEGWCDLGSGEAGVVIAVKDFAPQFPAELAADAGGVTARLWSGRDGKVLDYRPTTLARDWWGDWLNRVDKIAPASVGTMTTPEKVRERNPSAVGVARTHELFVGYYTGAQSEARARQWNAQIQSPPVVYPDPHWTCHVGARTFWPMAALGEGGPEFEDVEKFIAAYFDEFMAPLAVFPYAGWYDWGKHPELRYVKEPKENDRIYAQWWRLSYNNQYQTTKHLMLGWARSGDRRYLDTVRRFNRFQLDYKILHWSGGKENKRPGYFVWAGVHQLPFWFSGTGVLGMTGDTEFVTGPALEYLFLDNRWARDSLELVKKAVLADFRPTPKITKEAPDMVLSYLTGLYRVFPDDALRKTTQTLFDAITDVNAPVGMKESFFSEIGGHYTADYKLNRKAMALVEYCDVLDGDERARAIAAKAAKAAAAKARGSVCNYCEFHGASNARAWQWTRDAQCLEAARQQVTGVQKLFACYKRLPPDQKLVAHVRQFVTTNPLAMASPHTTYSFKESGANDADGKPLPLVFATCSSGVPYLALPTAIWAIKQKPDAK